MKTKRIALITTWFPPINGVAVSRMNAFANYLSEAFHVEVFCLGEKSEQIQKSENLTVHFSTSNKLFEKLKSNQSDNKLVHNAKTALRIGLKYIIKNPLDSWKKATIQKLKQRHKEVPFDLIISSYSPQEAHLVAIEFCKEFSKIPWIADMRDEMSSNPYIDLNTKNMLMAIEKDVNKYASAITSVSKPIVDEFRQICPSISYFEEIRNGFDHDLKLDNSYSTNSEFKLGYFGSFYGERKPDFVFNALVEIKKENPELKFSVHIYGAHNNYSIPFAIKDNVFKHSGLNYIDAIKEMNKLDANILIHPRTKHKGVFSGKIFDYISAKKPILAFVDKDDVAAQLIIEMNCGYVAEFGEVNENKKILLSAINHKQVNDIKIASEQDRLTLHRKFQVKKLADLISNLTEQ